MLALHALLGITLAHSFIATSPFVPILAERQTADSIEPPSTKISDSATHPDIYYIIPDGYPSDAWLEEAMNYDNSYFTGCAYGSRIRCHSPCPEQLCRHIGVSGVNVERAIL